MHHICFLIVFFGLHTASFADSTIPAADTIVGKWQYYKILYRGNIQDPPNPNLILTFEFKADRTNRLHWTRKGETDFCERTGEYLWQNNLLEDKVTWVNPDNAAECGRDPDMRLGHKTITRAEIKGGDFWLYFYLGDDLIAYIWKKI